MKAFKNFLPTSPYRNLPVVEQSYEDGVDPDTVEPNQIRDLHLKLKLPKKAEKKEPEAAE